MIMTFQVLPKKNESLEELAKRIGTNYPGGLITPKKGFLEVVHFKDFRDKEKAIWIKNGDNHCLFVLFKEDFDKIGGIESCFAIPEEDDVFSLKNGGHFIGKMTVAEIAKKALVVRVCARA